LVTLALPHLLRHPLTDIDLPAVTGSPEDKLAFIEADLRTLTYKIPGSVAYVNDNYN